MDHFEGQGWHIFPLLWVDDFLLPTILRLKLGEGPGHAKAEVMRRLIDNREALKEYMRERASSLWMADAERERRLGAVFRQFNQVCVGQAEETATTHMVNQAEGFFNTVTRPLGRPRSAFYAQDQTVVEKRSAVLETLHASIPEGNAYLTETFDRRRYKRFRQAPERSIPVRNQLDHGGGLEYWTQEHGLWATGFLFLTLEYLEALCAAQAPMRAPL